MIRINLLPYRQRRRRQQVLQHLAVLVGAIGVVTLGIVVVHATASSELASLQQQYEDLRRQNQLLQRKIGEIRNIDRLRAEVEQKLGLVDELQQGRFRSFRTLLAIAEAIPQNVWLTRLEDRGTQIYVKGMGESPKAVANFMRALDAREEFTNVKLGSVKTAEVDGVVLRSFDLTFDRVQPGAGKQRPARRRR